jgi:hypothetical protein
MENIKEYLDQGGNPNIKNKYGQSLIEIAIKSNNLDFVKLLLDYNVDPNSTDKIGRSILEVAVKNNNQDIVNLLIEKGANVNIENAFGKNILELALITKNKSIIKSITNKLKNQLSNEQILSLLDKINIELFELNEIKIVSDSEYCDLILFIINNIGMDEKTTLNYLQGLFPKPICPSLEMESKRAKLSKKFVRAFGKITIPKIDRGNDIVIKKSDFNINQKCFCLDYNNGVYQNTMYIPIIRYGKSENEGFYGKGEIKNSNFTWYYLEPDSKIYLKSDKTLITKNKVTAIIDLFRMRSDLDPNILFEFLSNIYINIYGDQPSDINKFEKDLKNEKYIHIGQGVNNYFELDDGGLLFSGGKLDYLDPYITEFCRDVNIDVVILTHQSGNSGRLVSECVDSRNRKISYNNLFKF